jgi:Mg2+-importing ATPase
MSVIFGFWLGKSLGERVDEYNQYIKRAEFEKKNPKEPPKNKNQIINDLQRFSSLTKEEIFSNLETDYFGLNDKKVKIRLHVYGKNELDYKKKKKWYETLLHILINPLIILFFFIIVVSLFTQDYKTSFIISLMVFISLIIRFIQETKAYNEAEKLMSLVKTTATVIRNGKKKEVDLINICPGDIVYLSAGDLIPADLRIIESKDLYVNQSFLTGESLPVEKNHFPETNTNIHPSNLKNICLMGTNVESGYAIGVVIHTGKNTYLNTLTKDIAGTRPETAFDKGIENFTYLMIKFMFFMVPTVFLVNGITKGNWFEAFLFGISIAVGLTPEMLPAIVTLNLSKGAINMAKKKTIVKNLNSIQNFGAMDVLCTDKTGTLTLNKVTVIKYFNVLEEKDDKIIDFAFINSFFQTGFKNLIDTSLVDYQKKIKRDNIYKDYKKIDEVPFDFKRKRLSIIVENKNKEKILICKGAVEEVLSICSRFEIGGKDKKIDKKIIYKIKELNNQYSNEGYRLIAVAYKKIDANNNSNNLEKDLVFIGLVCLLDPPKQSAHEAIEKLKNLGVEVKILTGDNELVTKRIAQELKINNKGVILGEQIEQMDQKTLEEVVEKNTIFAKLLPHHKKRVVEALRKKHIVGFLGDGINDAPSLRVSDVGISVDGAVDVAKESADIILLENNLKILADGVIEGRKIFANIIKYLRMGASSNFGNMFSVLGASIFLPFLPMKPIQILANSLLYDTSQLAIPFDNVDKDYIQKPRKCKIDDIRRFIIYIGPVSSIFDYATYFVMLFVFNSWNNPSLFQTGWFVESLLTQTLIIHVIRSKGLPFIQSRAHPSLTLTTILISFTGIFLVNSPFAPLFGFTTLPLLYWPILVGILISYILLTQLVKIYYIKKFGWN